MNANDNLPHFNASARPVWKFDGPTAAVGSGLGQHLIQVHDQIRAETRKLLVAVNALTQNEDSPESARTALEALSLRQNHPGLGGLCSGFCELLTIHHTMEDHKAFPGLAVAHPGLSPVLKQLYDEHEVVAELIMKMDAALAATPAAVTQIKAISQILAEQLLSHLDYEESQLVKVLESTSNVLQQ